MTVSDILCLYEITPKKMKLHMAIGKTVRSEPWIKLSQGQFKAWQEWQNQENFQREYILSFVFLRKNEWLFAGIYTADSCTKYPDHFEYSTTLTDYGKELIGRLVVFFEKDFRASYLLAEKHVENMLIQEIHREKFVCDPFPGYENVRIQFESLRQITSTEEYSWKTALSIVKGIYLITDTNNGKLYVGKADGENALWQRWCSYASNGHGDNQDLITLLNERGEEYKINFQYSLLEVLPKTIDDDFVDSREIHWKEVLCTRKHGYNRN